jgi:hypothetical protein
MTCDHLTTRAIEATASRQLNVHAAGVSDTHGRVVALVGESGAGKSTAAATLARSGWGYVSDEVVAVGDDGGVIAFPRPVMLERSGDTPGKVAHSPDELGLGRCADALQIDRLVLLDRRQSVSGPRIERLGLIDGLLELIPQVSALSRRANPLQRLCRLVDRCGGVYRLTYSEADQLLPVLAELVDADAGLREPWWPAHMPTTRASALMDARVRRPPHRDAIVTEEEYLLLVDSTPVRLAGIGATAWEACDDAPTLQELTRRVVEVNGPHPEAAQLVNDAVMAMVRGGALGWKRPLPIEAMRRPARELEIPPSPGAA